MTKYSEERMFPEEPDSGTLEFVNLWLKQYEEHVARYRFFTEYAKDKCVLDVGCGYGYGSAILSNHHAKTVIGIDNSDQVLKYASDKYNSNNIYYTVSDATNTPFADKIIDTIYAFEVIEHIKNADAFLSEMKRILKDDGNIFISTPNKKLSGYEDGSKVNKFHFREYRLEEFRDLIDNYFSDVQIYGERYSNRYNITESNLHSMRIMREKIISLEQEIYHLNYKLDRIHEELFNKIVPGKLLKFFNKLYRNSKYENREHSKFHSTQQVEPLISIAPSQNEIVINKDNLDDALYFIGACRK